MSVQVASNNTKPPQETREVPDYGPADFPVQLIGARSLTTANIFDPDGLGHSFKERDDDGQRLIYFVPKPLQEYLVNMDDGKYFRIPPDNVLKGEPEEEAAAPPKPAHPALGGVPTHKQPLATKSVAVPGTENDAQGASTTAHRRASRKRPAARV